MKKKLITYFFLIYSTNFLIGCQPDIVNMKTPVLEKAIESNKKVESVTITEAPENISSPSEVIIHQFLVTFSDGEKKYPTKDSVIFESTLGKNSIVGIRSPEGMFLRIISKIRTYITMTQEKL